MEVSSRMLPSFSGAGIDSQPHRSSFKPSLHGVSFDTGSFFSGEIRLSDPRHSRVSVKPRKSYGFCDDGHLLYYSSTTRCGGAAKEKEKVLVSAEKKMKKRLKLVKGLSKDLSVFSDMGFGLDSEHGLADQVKGKMISEAADLLLGQLQQLKAEKKEMKRKKKEEKAKMKAMKMQNRLECGANSSSSSESSDSECGEVVDMTSLKNQALNPPVIPVIPETTPITFPNPPEQQGTTAELLPENQETMSSEIHRLQISGQICCSTGTTVSNNVGNSLEAGALATKIEVCMGGKCKKSGAASLMEEFQKAVGVEGSVVGCKCMGKCRDGPNVRVLNSIDGNHAEMQDDSVRTPVNPLCIGVGLEDVGLIVSNFFGGNQKDLGFAVAS